MNDNSLTIPNNNSLAVAAQAPSVSILTAANPGRLAKQFSLDSAGALVKEPGGNMIAGRYHRTPAGTPQALADLIVSLQTNQALCFGTAGDEPRDVTVKQRAGEGAIARSKDYFDWPVGPGWLMVDHDPAPGAEPLSPLELMFAIVAALGGWPAFFDPGDPTGLKGGAIVAMNSGSSHIYHGDECLKARGGLRLYIKIADASDTERAGGALCDRLWLAGYGRYDVSAAGSALERTVIDRAVYSPERLDFAAGAACVAPLEQRRPAPFVWNNEADALDTRRAIPDLTDDEQERVAFLREQEHKATAGARAKARQGWLDSRTDEQAKREGVKSDAGRARIRKSLERSLDESVLHGGFVLYHAEDGAPVTVAEVLADPAEFDRAHFLDPLEPDYAAGKDVAIAYVDENPGIWSHAHGGRFFRMVAALATIQAAPGDLPAAVAEVHDLMAQAGAVYQRGGELVRVLGSADVHPVGAPWLRNHLESIVSWQKYDKRAKKWQPSGMPSDLDNRILNGRGDWRVPELTGVVAASLMRLDGSLLDRPGFDADTGLLLKGCDFPPVPAHPTVDQIRRALATLWRPFEYFPFDSPLSRAVHLAALLTAVERPIFETAPAFGYDAPKAGSGKSKLAQAAAWLGGSAATASPWSTEGEEQRKRLMAELVAARPSIMLDNVTAPMRSPTLCAILTAPRFVDRRLGFTETVSAPTRVFITANGNNLRIAGDLARRVLVSTIDHGVESPETLPFEFDPVAMVRKDWRMYRAAALTVLRGFADAGMPKAGPGLMGSYEDWDRMIRQCVLWLQSYTDMPLADVADAVRANYEADPDTRKLAALLTAWWASQGSRPVRCADLIRIADIPATEADAALKAIVEEIAGERTEINSRRLGRWIESHAGRIVDGFRIVPKGERYKVRLWAVEPCETA